MSWEEGGVGSDAEGFQNCRAPDTLTNIPKFVLGTVFIVLGCAMTDNIRCIPREEWFKGGSLRM